jgi:cytochrome c biogenesis protein CcdA
MAGLVFSTSYAISAKWWKSFEGRLMMVLSTSTSATYLITLCLTIGGFKTSTDWLRFAQATLTFSIGTCFIYYTFLVWKTQANRGKKK